jgi:hypothetical protein
MVDRVGVIQKKTDVTWENNVQVVHEVVENRRFRRVQQ